MSVALVRFSAPFWITGPRFSHHSLYDTSEHVIIHKVTQTCRLGVIVGIDDNVSYRLSRGNGEALHRTVNARTVPKNIITCYTKIWKFFNPSRSTRSDDTSRLIEIDIDPTPT